MPRLEDMRVIVIVVVGSVDGAGWWGEAGGECERGVGGGLGGRLWDGEGGG